MDQVTSLLETLSSAIGTPRALSVKLLAQAGEWAQLQQLRVNPWDYASAKAFKADAIITDFARKCDVPGDKERKRQAAVDTFWSCEAQCAKTNAYIRRLTQGPVVQEDFYPLRILDFWRAENTKLLGCLPQELTPSFSKGSTVSDKGSLVTIPDKMSSVPTCYPQTVALLPFFWQTSWGRVVRDRGLTPHLVRANTFFTVPKDGTKDRGCAMESSISLSLQLSTGKKLRARLHDWGLDLQRGQDLHRELAMRASRGDADCQLATLDLSNASDTISRRLVESILPRDWFLLLNSLRATHTSIDGKTVYLEKFSSMGNGYTFELESLLFYSLARVACRESGLDPSVEVVSVYGDDIILPVAASAKMQELLRTFGLTPNASKSYDSGPFRESCGGDFFEGQPVRAYFLKREPCEPHEWIGVINGLRRLDCPDLVNGARNYAKRQLPRQIRACVGPEVLGDIVIHQDVETLPPGKKFRAWTPVPKQLQWNHWKGDVQLACTTLGLPSQGVTPRASVEGYRFRWVEDPRGSTWLP